MVTLYFVLRSKGYGILAHLPIYFHYRRHQINLFAKKQIC